MSKEQKQKIEHNQKKALKRHMQFTEEYYTCYACKQQVKLKNHRDHETRRCTKCNWHSARYFIWASRN